MPKSDVIKSLADKVSVLIAENRKLREECVKLTGSRDKLRSDNRKLSEEIAKLEKRLAILEIKESLGGAGDPRIARARINRLMREVDKCIALLNR